MSTFTPLEPEVMAGFDLFNPTEEHKILRETMARFVADEVEPQAAEYNREEKFNRALFNKMGEMGLLGITVPEAWGGGGMDCLAAVIVHEMLSTSDPGFALAYLAHSMLFVNNFYQSANDEQRRRYLPKVCSGEWVGGMCLTEPEVGTDVQGMRTSATRSGDHYLINGAKMFITNGALDEKTPGDIFLVYAKTSGGMTSFIVEKGFEGFSLGQKLHDKCGVRSSLTAELVFDNCRVPLENLIGEEGDSIFHMMRNLELERLTLAAMSLGIAQRCVQVMTNYAAERKAFGQPLNRFGQIQRHIAESYAKYKAARAYAYDTARRTDLSAGHNRIDSDGVKLFASVAAKEIADSAMQVLGGYGYMGEYVVERLWRDAKLIEIGGGTLEAHHKNLTKDLTRDVERWTR